MCRAEAHQLFARKPIFDSLGIQLVAVLHEHIEEEVWAFWPRYWGAMIVLDEKRDFFKALGGGKLMKDNFLTEFFLNPMARLNWKRALKTGIQYSSNGEGLIKGGLYIVRKGKGGVAYQFVEKSYGDWAPLDEILQVCHFIKVTHPLHFVFIIAPDKFSLAFCRCTSIRLSDFCVKCVPHFQLPTLHAVTLLGILDVRYLTSTKCVFCRTG
jgi:hypothetical protein